MIETVVLHRRHARRYQQIVRVLMAHGLGGIIAPFDPRGRRSADNLEIAGGLTGRKRAIHLRRALEQLGPTFIKLGQILSTRADILPPVYIEELSRLREDVPADASDEILAILTEELGAGPDELFARFDREPIAAASIGQVHAAELTDGRQVVVKVQRPNVQRVVQEDLAILADVARVAEERSEFLRRNRVSDLMREFAWTLRQELDYRNEARNIERFLRSCRNDRAVRIPEVISEYSTSRVLTMERLSGVPVTELGGYPAGTSVHDVVRAVVLFLAKGILADGVYHADPHPGNLALMDDGSIAVYDFGMVGVLDARTKDQLLMLMMAVTERDASRVVDEVAQIGIMGPGFDRKALERDMAHLITMYVGVPLSTLPLESIVADAMDMMRRHEMHLPAELALLAKTATMTEAFARSLDPNINVFEVVEPIVRSAMKQFVSVGYWKERLRTRPLEVALLGAALPGHMQRILSRIDRDDLAIRTKIDDLDITMRTMERMVNRLALTILAAAGIIALGMAFLAVRPELLSWHGVVFFVLAIPLLWVAGMVVWGIRGSGRR